jgi:hypothetical protein
VFGLIDPGRRGSSALASASADTGEPVTQRELRGNRIAVALPQGLDALGGILLVTTHRLEAGVGQNAALIDGYQRGLGSAGLVLVLAACLGLSGLRKVADLGRPGASVRPARPTGPARHPAS